MKLFELGFLSFHSHDDFKVPKILHLTTTNNSTEFDGKLSGSPNLYNHTEFHREGTMICLLIMGAFFGTLGPVYTRIVEQGK